jgi:hypothetical protein
MSINIPEPTLSIKGQCVKQVNYQASQNTIHIICRRDRRYKPKDSVTYQSGKINRYVRRKTHDLSWLNCRCEVEVELIKMTTQENKRRIEHSDFVEQGSYYSHRFCRLISGLCRYELKQGMKKYLCFIKK